MLLEQQFCKIRKCILYSNFFSTKKKTAQRSAACVQSCAYFLFVRKGVLLLRCAESDTKAAHRRLFHQNTPHHVLQSSCFDEDLII